MASETINMSTYHARRMAQTPDNTTTFLRGDNTFSNILTGNLTIKSVLLLNGASGEHSIDYMHGNTWLGQIGFNANNFYLQVHDGSTWKVPIIVTRSNSDITLTGYTKIAGNHYITGTTTTDGTIGSTNYLQTSNLGEYINNSSSVTGMLVITLPYTSGQYDMVDIKIYVYEYDSNGASEILVGGHNWNNAWYNTSFSVEGNYNKAVRLACDGTNYCVVLGATNSVWHYPQIYVKHIFGGYGSNTPKALVSKCSFAMKTSESGYTFWSPARSVKHAQADGLNTAPGTTTTFYRGDQTWSSALTGSLNVGSFLNLNGTATERGINFLTGSTYWYQIDAVDSRLIFYTHNGSNWAEALDIIRDNRYIGIGTNSPSSKLHVNGGLIKVTNNSCTLTMGAANGSWCHMEAGLTFYFNPSVCIDGACYPYTHNTRDLGTSSKYWKNLYAINMYGTLYGSSTGVYTATASGGNVDAMKAIWNSLPTNQTLGVYIAHGSAAFFYGWRLSGYSVGNAYGGGIIDNYGNPSYLNVSNGSFVEKHIWLKGDAVTSAVWNDYAEARAAFGQPGQVVYELGDDTCVPTTERLQHFAGIVSDTWGFSQGETDSAKTHIAVAGRVLAYPYRDRDEYKPGDVLCAAPNGTVDIMTREEAIQYPDRIVGTVSCVPNYEEWGGGEGADRPPVKVNGRIWVKVR